MDGKVLMGKGRHEISRERPRVLGSREQLRKLKAERPEAYKRMLDVARRAKNEGYDQLAKIIGLSIGYVLGDVKKEDVRCLVDIVLVEYVDKPIRTGHQTFAHDMARCAIVYDLCYDLWTPGEKERFRKYTHTTIDMNVESEASPFHNGWWGYKHWGYGLAAYALMYDDPGARKILDDMEREYLEDGVPCLKMAGEGGGWGEGYYIHYWSFEWIFLCEVARWVEGVDYYAAADFWKQRSVAAMFENYPKMEPPKDFPANNKYPMVKASEPSRRLIPMSDGHGKYPKHERDKTLATRRALVNHYRDDPTHQVVHTYNLQTPKPAIEANAFMDFFWHDPTVKAGNLDNFKLSHVSAGPGFVYARSSWKDDATYFFFKCGPRFTAHQHMDNGTFHIFKNEELIGDGGHYDGFSSEHAVNYYMRTIAHSSILIFDPAEKYPEKTPETPRGMRFGPPGDNDGGQTYFWQMPGRNLGNGGVGNVPAFEKNRDILDIGTITAYRDRGTYLYTAGDYTKSYSSHKAKCVTRQIVYLRPGTFVIFDRVESTNPAFKKTLLFQAIKTPEKRGEFWVETHGNGRLFIQTLSPTDAAVELYDGEKLYTYGSGKIKHPPEFEMDAAAECRMEISPKTPAAFDYFLHVLTTADAKTQTVPTATASRSNNEVTVKVGEATIRFALDRMAGAITLKGVEEKLVDGIEV